MPRPTPDFDSSELELHSGLPARTSVCPPLDVLLALEQDALPEELAGPARAHLAGCSLCTMLLADMADLPEPAFTAGQQERIAAFLPQTQTTYAPRWMNKGLIGLAAAVLLAVGLLLWTHRERKVEVARVDNALMPGGLQPKEIPFAPLAAPSGSASLLTRGGPDGEPSNDQLLPAFRAYNRGDYAISAKQFGLLSAEYPRSGMVLLYLGVSQLALQQNEQAATTLRHAGNTYDADAVQWYSAIAASRVHPAEAQPLLAELCQKKASAYSARSCDALR